MAQILTRGLDQLIISDDSNRLNELRGLITSSVGRSIQMGITASHEDRDFAAYKHHNTWIIPEKNTLTGKWQAFHDGVEEYFNTEEVHPLIVQDLNSYNRFIAIVHGYFLKRRSLKSHFKMYQELREKGFNISSLHLKVSVKNPQKGIDYIRKLSRVDNPKKSLSDDVCGFTTGAYLAMNTKFSEGSCNSIYFGNRTAHKQLCIYDPFIMHGETNSQHWELRIRGKYMNHALYLLDSCNSSVEFEKTIQSIVFGAIDFRKGNDRNLNRRKRHRWYSDLLKGIEPQKLMQNETFSRKG